MAIIKSMPAEAIISGFKGTLDFYYYMGLLVVRKWPSSPGHIRTIPVMAQWEAWSFASKTWNNLSQEVRDAYITTAAFSSLSGRDLYMKSFISDYFREGQWG